MKSIIVSVTVIVVGLTVLVWWSNSKTAGVPENHGSLSELSVPEALYDFGTISMKNGLVDHSFTITNSSDEDVFVKKVVTSCMCTTAFIKNGDNERGPFGMEGMGFVPPANETIKAGESREMKVVFDPNAHGPAGVGPIDRFVYVTDDSSNTLQLEIKAVVTP